MGLKNINPWSAKNEITVYAGTDGDVGDGRGPDTGKTRNKYEEPGKGGLT